MRAGTDAGTAFANARLAFVRAFTAATSASVPSSAEELGAADALAAGTAAGWAATTVRTTVETGARGFAAAVESTRDITDEFGLTTTLSARALTSSAFGAAAASRAPGSRVTNTAITPTTASPSSDTPTPFVAGVAVDVSSALSAGLPGRISGVRLATRKAKTGAPQRSQVRTSSLTMLLQDGQVTVEGTVMPGVKRARGQRVGCPRCVGIATASRNRSWAESRRVARK